MTSGDRGRPLPPKLYFRIGEVAGLVGVEPHVLRYWEREFRTIRPTKSAKGQRVYSRRDVENLLRVRDLLYQEGFTIAGAKKRLMGAEPAPKPAPKAAPPPPLVTPPRIREKLTALRREIEAFLEELD
jgi:DNA-binding transcriptional MerR regulator